MSEANEKEGWVSRLTRWLNLQPGPPAVLLFTFTGALAGLLAWASVPADLRSPSSWVLAFIALLGLALPVVWKGLLRYLLAGGGVGALMLLIGGLAELPPGYPPETLWIPAIPAILIIAFARQPGRARLIWPLALAFLGVIVGSFLGALFGSDAATAILGFGMMWGSAAIGDWRASKSYVPAYVPDASSFPGIPLPDPADDPTPANPVWLAKSIALAAAPNEEASWFRRGLSAVRRLWLAAIMATVRLRAREQAPAAKEPVLRPPGRLLPVSVVRGLAVLSTMLGVLLPWVVLKARLDEMRARSLAGELAARPPLDAALKAKVMWLKPDGGWVWRLRTAREITWSQLHALTGAAPREAIATPDERAIVQDPRAYCDALSRLEGFVPCYQDKLAPAYTCEGYRFYDGTGSDMYVSGRAAVPFFAERFTTDIDKRDAAP